MTALNGAPLPTSHPPPPSPLLPPFVALFFLIHFRVGNELEEEGRETTAVIVVEPQTAGTWLMEDRNERSLITSNSTTINLEAALSEIVAFVTSTSYV